MLRCRHYEACPPVFVSLRSAGDLNVPSKFLFFFNTYSTVFTRTGESETWPRKADEAHERYGIKIKTGAEEVSYKADGYDRQNT